MGPFGILCELPKAEKTTQTGPHQEPVLTFRFEKAILSGVHLPAARTPMAKKKTSKTKAQTFGMDPKKAVKKGTKNPSPVVLMFQPTDFVPVPNDRLAEWEQLLLNRLGLRLPKGSHGIVKGETVSGTRPDVIWDDCDWDREPV